MLNSSPSSLSGTRLDTGQRLPAGALIVDDGNDDHDSSSGHQQQQQRLETLMPTDQGTISNLCEAGNTTMALNAYKKTIIINNEAPICCLCPSVDLEKKLSREFFEQQRSLVIDRRTKWTGREYEEWVAIWSRLNPNHENQTSLSCATQYTLLVLDQVSGFYLRSVLTELRNNGKLKLLPYNKEKPRLPRILLLGDSISRGIRVATQQGNHWQANIQGAPGNCNAFERYQKDLKQWLGYCPWDVVQFNVGMHFHPEFPDNYTSWRDEYRRGITNVVNEIRDHSTSAHIVFALTTPSPFDSDATTPDRATCPHYDKFHKAGFVAAMNEVAISLSEELGIIINDRYSVILPVLDQYQKKCDVHYDYRGYQFIARHDWKVFSAALSLKL